MIDNYDEILQNVFTPVNKTIGQDKYFFSSPLFELKSPIDTTMIIYKMIQWEHRNNNIYYSYRKINQHKL